MLNFKGGARLLFLLSLIVLLFVWAGCSDDESTGPVDPGGTGNLSGLVTVRCFPTTLDIPWTLSTPDGTQVYGENSQVLEDMPSGQYQISWGAINGWRMPYPDPDYRELTSTGTLDFPGIYQLEPGSVYIKVLPSGMEARWTLLDSDGMAVASGSPDSTVTGLVTGAYTLTWEAFDNVRASNVPISLTSESHGVQVYGNYQADERYIMLIPSPAGIPAPWTVTSTGGASFSGTGTDSVRIDGPVVEGADFFDYTIVWGDVQGYDPPVETEFLILEADTTSSYLISPVYTLQPVTQPTGTVSVNGTIGSSEVNWELEGPQGLLLTGSGDRTMTGMAAGSYAMHWLPTDGWAVPMDDTADLADGATISFTAHNDPAVTIAVQPADLACGWQLAYPSGATHTGVGSAFVETGEIGNYTLTWQEVSGWNTPAAQTLNMTQTQGLVFEAEYTRIEGNLFVQTYPLNLEAGWTVTGPEGFSYTGSGQEALQLTTAGSYRIDFDDAEGYLKPAHRYFDLDPAATSTIDGTYLMAFDMVAISPVLDYMGSPGNENCRDADEGWHQVDLNTDFKIMTTEVTNAQYVAAANWAVARGYAVLEDQVLRDNQEGSVNQLLDLTDGDHEISIQDGLLVCRNPNHPVKEVTWYGAAAYCDWVTQHQNLPRTYDRPTWRCNGFEPYQAAGYRLPTEAEWEYAARAGTDTPFPNGNLSVDGDFCSSSTLSEIAWWSGNAEFWSREVGQLDANDFGLYDMHGNVAEWCNDWYDAIYYEYASRINPRGPSVGETKVVRGGYFYSTVEDCRSGNRDDMEPATASFRAGFRMVIRGSE